jgi:hypothetical protein
MPMLSATTEYDVFVSYAKTDNSGSDHFVEQLIDSLARAHQARIGRELRVFFDRRNIASLYADVGVPDAARAVEELQSADKSDAERLLLEAYTDDDLMSSLPFDV